MKRFTLKDKIIYLGMRGYRQIDVAKQIGTSRGYVSQIYTMCGLKELTI